MPYDLPESRLAFSKGDHGVLPDFLVPGLVLLLSGAGIVLGDVINVYGELLDLGRIEDDHEASLNSLGLSSQHLGLDAVILALADLVYSSG